MGVTVCYIQLPSFVLNVLFYPFLLCCSLSSSVLRLWWWCSVCCLLLWACVIAFSFIFGSGCGFCGGFWVVFLFCCVVWLVFSCFLSCVLLFFTLFVWGMFVSQICIFPFVVGILVDIYNGFRSVLYLVI